MDKVTPVGSGGARTTAGVKAVSSKSPVVEPTTADNQTTEANDTLSTVTPQLTSTSGQLFVINFTFLKWPKYSNK